LVCKQGQEARDSRHGDKLVEYRHTFGGVTTLITEIASILLGILENRLRSQRVRRDQKEKAL